MTRTDWSLLVPLIHLFLEFLAEFIDPLLQPLPPLFGGQVAEILQRWSLVERNSIGGSANSTLTPS